MAETPDTKSQLGSNLLRVRLSEIFKEQIDPFRTFVCDVTPSISETQSVNYETFDPIHGPGSILSFVNTPSRSFQVSNVKLLSRTKLEADKNLRYLNLLRSWTKPVFGRYATTNYDPKTGMSPPKDKDIPSHKNNQGVYSFQQQSATTRVDVLGAPPRVLEFSAYSTANDKKVGHINGIPVVITSLSFSYPDDVDYIPTTNFTPMPIMMTLEISLTEVHSPSEYANFSIAQYRNGSLLRF